MNQYEYLFSVIVPIYNTEKYLEECIESIVNQTIGFENIQLILINDGSPDNSHEICLNYKNKYPYNIVYEKKGNGGVSLARNRGYKYIKGKYVNFLDPDDKFESDGFEKIFNYFEVNYNKTNFIAIPMKSFENKDGVLEQYKKFTKICSVSVKIDVTVRQCAIINLFFKKELILKYYFDEECKFAEDFKLISTIIINELEYLYFTDTYYLYRIRNEKNSATDIVNKDITYINHINTNHISIVYQYLIDICTKRFGYVLEYIQRNSLICIWMVYGNIKSYTTDKNLFLDDLYKFLQYIDDEIIIKLYNDGFYDTCDKLFILQLKNKKFDAMIDNKLDIDFLKSKGFLSNYDIKLNEFIWLELKQEDIEIFVNNNKNVLSINGYFVSMYNINIDKIYLEVEQDYFLVQIKNIEEINLWNKKFKDKYNFRINLDYEKCKSKNMIFYLDIDGKIENYPLIINI